MTLIPGSISRRPRSAVRGETPPRVAVARKTARVLHVRLTGALPQRWFGALTARCALHRISLLSGHALLEPRGVWNAELQLESLGPIDELPDFLGWATSPAPAAPSTAKILDFELFARAARPNVLVLEVHAWESVGLLAGVLAHVDRIGLVPVEVLLETEDDCAFHQITLTAPSGGAPSTSNAARLARTLRGAISAG